MEPVIQDIEKKLLIVDDDLLVREALEEFMKDEGYTAYTANNGEEGLALYQEQHPQIIILDLNMPKLGGIQFLEKLNFNTDLSTSVIVLTGYGSDEDIQKCFTLGIQSFLRKPVNLYELGGMIEKMFELLHQSSQLQQEIGKKEEAFNQLEIQHDKLKTTIDHISEGIITLDKSLKVEMISAHACQILELQESDVVGKRVGLVLQPSITGPDGVLSQCIQEQNEVSNTDLQYEYLPGKTKPLSISITPMTSTFEEGWLLIFKSVESGTSRSKRKSVIPSFGKLVGQSPQIKEVFDLIKKVSASKANILIQGASGTGKELVAREIHKHSPQARNLFHAVNCAAISPHLLESDFFGHERGAFTGAYQTKKGRFELAHKGTLFLDEIGELPLELQGKLLRVLQEQTFERVGGTTTIQVDVRLISATNRDLKEMVENKLFREDLYYRLRVIPIVLPNLVERQQDIPLLITSFIDKLNHIENRNVQAFSKGALTKLNSYSWPGNIRELYNVIEYAFAISQSDILQIDHLPPEIQNSSNSPFQPSSSTDEKNRILEALQKTHHHKIKAAGLLGMHPATLYRKLKKYNID